MALCFQKLADLDAIFQKKYIPLFELMVYVNTYAVM